MKNKITYNLIAIIICIFFAEKNATAGNYVWTGNSSTAWGTGGNWNPLGVPGALDTAEIKNASNNPVLGAKRTVTRFIMTSGTLTMNSDSLIITGSSAFHGGTLSGSAINALQPGGNIAVFDGTTFSVDILSIVGIIELSGSTFNNRCYFEQTGTTDGIGAGGNTFSSSVTIVKSGKSVLRIANTSPNTFSSNVTFTNSNSKVMVVTDKGKSIFNGNITVNNTGDDGISFGDVTSTGGDTSKLASGKTISAGTFSSGTLLLLKFTQLGTTDQTITLTSVAVVNMIRAIFNGKLSIEAPAVLARNSTFDTLFVTQTGGTDCDWSGKNTFNKPTTITNHGDAGLQLATDTADTYNSDITFINDSTGTLQPCYSDTNYIKGNLTATGTQISFYNSGTVRFSGSNDQYIYGDNNFRFNNISMKKTSGIVTLNKAITIEGVLELNKGIIVCDTTNMLSMSSTSDARGSSDSSFVDGPVKKTGNGSFVFPIGNYIHFRPLTITAPSSSSDAFLAQYFDMGQIQGDSLDTTLTEVSPCNNWLFLRKNGSSNVSISLPWDTSYCSVFDTTHMHLAFWNDTIWKDKGHGTFSGTAVSGKMTSAAAVTKYGYFSLATTVGPQTCVSPYDVYLTNTNVNSFGSYTINNQSVLITGTFEINHDFTFTNCQIIKMAPDAKIIVDATKTLNINLSTISPCGTHQWDYIKINDYTATLNVAQSTLEGADSAIWSVNGGVYNVVRGTRINRCWKGIMVDAFASPHSGIIQDSWIGCATVAGGSGPALLYAPHTTARTSKGIHVIDVNSITFGHNNTTVLDNNFFNTTLGIYAENTNFTVNNCNFTIHERGIHAVRHTGSHTLTVGDGTNNSCNFSTCGEGIRSNQMNILISNNSFDGMTDYGIRVVWLGARNVDISANEFTRFNNIGVGIYHSLNGDIRVISNNFNAPGQVFNPYDGAHYGSYAVQVENPVGQFTDVNVSANYITNTRYGIELKNCTNVNIGAQFFSYGINVNGNNFYYPISFTNLQSKGEHKSIMLAECTWSMALGNIIDRTSSSHTIDGTEWTLMTGIYFEQVDYSLAVANIISNISSGVNFQVTDMFSYITCTHFTECYAGVDLGKIPEGSVTCTPVVTMSNQYGIGVTLDRWDADPTHHADLGRVYGRTSFPINWHGPGTTVANPFFPNNTQPTGCNDVIVSTSAWSTQCPVSPEDEMLLPGRDSLLSGIVLDTLIHSEHHLERRYMLLQSAYQMLDDDTNLLHVNGNDSVYIAFYNRHKRSNIGKFRYIEKLINAENFSAAADSLSHIADTNTIESYRKVTLDKYLNIDALEDTMDATDSADLVAIAYDCVIMGGKAVHEARAMLGIHVSDSCSGDVSRYAGNGLLVSTKSKTKDYFYIQPNPAHSFILATYRIENSTSAEMKIMDIAGRIIKSFKIPPSGSLYKIDTSGLPQGLYFYSVEGNNQTKLTGKIIME